MYSVLLSEHGDPPALLTFWVELQSLQRGPVLGFEELLVQVQGGQGQQTRAGSPLLFRRGSLPFFRARRFLSGAKEKKDA